MNVEQILELGVADAGAAIATRHVSSTAVTEAILGHLSQTDAALHAFITVDSDGALTAAAQADKEIAAGHHRGPLHGVPIAIKDNIPTANLRTTFNSHAYASSTPKRDAPAVTRLRDAGAVIVGKTNLNEFGWSIPADTDLMPPPRNPWNPDYRAVGSSSGSAVAVAARMCCAALGTDGGGSTRLPAGQMGLVGLKPTRGSIPPNGDRIGEVSVVGVLGRNTRDTAAVYSVLAAQELDLQPSLDGARLAIPRRQIDELPLEADVATAFATDLDRLATMGAELIDVDIPLLQTARDANFIIIAALAHSDHADDLRHRSQMLSDSTRQYLLSGAAVSVEDYLNARQLGRNFERQLNHAIQGCAGLVTPVSTVVTAEAARRPGEHNRGLNATFTSPFNLIGWPAISAPSQIGHLGIPIGLHIAARPRHEELLLNIGAKIAITPGFPAGLSVKNLV